MEQVQRLIIGNNVYDANDDELEAEVNPYLSNLVQKEKTAKDGKAAIITATQNKSGINIENNTYAEVINALNNIKVTSFSVPNLILYPYYEIFPFSNNLEIKDNKTISFEDYLSSSFTSPISPAVMYLDRTVIPETPNVQTNIKFEMQINLTIGEGDGAISPLMRIYNNYSSGNAIWLSLSKLSSTSLFLEYQSGYSYSSTSTKTITIDISNYNYFEIESIHNASLGDKSNKINIYGGIREEDSLSVSGYKPISKKLLYTITVESNHSYLISNNFGISLGGSDVIINSASTFNTSEVFIGDIGIRYTDDYNSTVIGSTNFLDMEVTS